MIKVTQTKNQVVIRLGDMEAGWLTKVICDCDLNGFCQDFLKALLKLKLTTYDSRYFGVRKEIKQKYKGSRDQDEN